MSFYSPIDKLMSQSTRPKGTGAEYMTELSKQPGFKQAEVEDRNLQALLALPKMDRAAFMAQLKAKPATMPKERVFRNDPKDLTYEEDYDKQYHGVTGEPYHEEHTLPGGTNYREILLQHPKGSFPGVAGHFGGAPDVLASIRAKDRVGPNGEKILHIEEIQSDWHKQGSKKGYQPKGVDLNKEADKAKMQHTLLSQKLNEARQSSDAIDRNLASDQPLYQNPEVRERQKQAQIRHNESIMDLMPQVMKAEEAHRIAKETARSAVPEAPFKKNWHELALKRMIHHAAEKGYHQIHITPGETQAERWGASGDGAKGFHDLYDKRIPQFLNKFGKQFGAQVGVHQLAIPPEKITEDSETQVVPMHSFRITPQMREDVLKNGMPLYSEGGEVVPAAEREANKAKFLEGSKIQKPAYHATRADIKSFDPKLDSTYETPDNIAGWFSEKPEFANDFATQKYRYWKTQHKPWGEDSFVPQGVNLIPAHLAMKKPFDARHLIKNLSESLNMTEAKKIAEVLGIGLSELLSAIPTSVKHKVTGEERPHVARNFDLVKSRVATEAMKRLGHDSLMALENNATVYAPFHPGQIKSAVGNRGTYDINEADINKAKGGAVKPVVHGIIKERVTVSPNLDAMQYELMSAKHFTKKVK